MSIGHILLGKASVYDVAMQRIKVCRNCWHGACSLCEGICRLDCQKSQLSVLCTKQMHCY